MPTMFAETGGQVLLPSADRWWHGLRASFTVVLSSFVIASVANGTPAKTPIDVGSTLQLFVDDHLIDSMQGTSLRLHSPERREVVFRFDAPWEGPESAYTTVLKDGEKWRMYYRGGGESTREVTCLAESHDGVQWTRPNLGLFEFNGFKSNNIVFVGARKAYRESHNFTPFIDQNPAARPEQRYKALALGVFEDETGERRKMLVALISPDGILWKHLREKPIITKGSFDSQNIAFWDTARRQYACYFREGRDGKRSVRVCTSSNFVDWSDSVWLEFGNAPLEQFYTSAITPYFREPHLYVGFPMRFVPERKTIGADARKVDALSDAVFITSRDGVNFQRHFLEAFIRPGLDPANWGNGHGNNTPAWGLLPSSPGEMSLYWCENYGRSPHVRRGVLRTDGFASVNAPYSGGEFVTRPLRFSGKQLHLNYSTSAIGSIRVELQTAEGTPVGGFGWNDCTEVYGDELDRRITWTRGGVLDDIPQPVRFRFVMKDADLYSVWFH